MWYELSGLSRIKNDMSIEKDCLYLDIGHGGKDTGCIFFDNSFEKDFVLKFGLAVYDLVKPYFKKVYINRTTDKTIELSTRTKEMKLLAEKNDRIQVYSIHCNAFNGAANGAEWLLSIHTSKTDSDYVFCKQFLNDYCNTFSLLNRGIVQKHTTRSKKLDYYYLHRNTPSNCKVKYIELFFGDNRSDFKKCTTQDYFNKAVFFFASYVLKRYGVKIDNPKLDQKDIKYIVQTGTFNSKDNASRLVKKLKSKGFDAIIKKG